MLVSEYVRCSPWSGVSVFFFKKKTAYEVRISDWSSDVCSSDLCMAFGDVAARRSQLRSRDQLLAGEAGRGELRHQRRGLARTHGHEHEIGRASCRERGCQYE